MARANNPAQSLEVRFLGNGAEVCGIGRSSAGAVTLNLAGIGRPGSLRSQGPARVAVDATRITYRYAGLRQWYSNLPGGLEQGFDVTHAPQGASSGRPLVLSLALTTRRSARLSGGALLLTTPGEPALRYGQLLVRDADDRQVPAHLELQGSGHGTASRLLLLINDRHALYPLHVDPVLSQATLTAPNGQSNDNFGFDVALSADGSTALVGAIGWNNFQGAAYVFVRSGSNWLEQAMLSAAGGVANSEFGNAVSLSRDGNTALIGARTAANDNGGAYIFVRSGTTWSEQTTLNNLAYRYYQQLGGSVALSGDGKTAVVGATGEDDPQGGALVFAHIQTGWQLQATLATGVANDYFGEGVAVSTNGDLALVSAPGVNIIHVYARTGTSWRQQATFGAKDGASDDFLGDALALNEAATMAIVGALGEDADNGAVFIFVRIGTIWIEQAKLLPQPSHPYFGMDVALSDDGTTALIGAEENSPWNGATYIFVRKGTSWSEQAVPTDPAFSPSWSFGFRAALSSDGQTELVGARYDGSAGAAYVFTVGTGGSGSATPTPSATATAGGNASPTGTPTITPSSTPNSPAPTRTSTATLTPTASQTPTATPSRCFRKHIPILCW